MRRLGVRIPRSAAGELHGCINDVHKMRAFLAERGGFGGGGGSMVVLTDDSRSSQQQVYLTLSTQG